MGKNKLSILMLSLLLIIVGMASCGGGDDSEPATTVSLSTTSLQLQKGETSTLRASISPAGDASKSVRWTTSDAKVATVDGTGTVTAVGTGTATITASVGSATATCTVTVSVNVKSITLSENALVIEKGSQATITATVLPDDATDKSVTWSTSNPSVATVMNGTITAVGGGQSLWQRQCTITATSADGKVSASCNVTVTISVQSVSLDQTSLTLIKGQQVQITATVLPDDASSKEVVWSSSDNNVVRVERTNIETGTITAVGTGTATITATTTNGNKTASCNVTVDKSTTVGYDPYGDGQQW